MTVQLGFRDHLFRESNHLEKRKMSSCISYRGALHRSNVSDLRHISRLFGTRANPHKLDRTHQLHRSLDEDAMKRF